jgi:hypothetical protein
MVYLFCLTNEKQLPESLAEEVHLRVEPVGEMRAIWKEVAEEEYGEATLPQQLQRIDWLEGAVREHLRVIAEVHEAGAALPFPFVSIFHDLAGMHQALAEKYDALRQQLQWVTGKQEWDLKVYRDPEREEAALARSPAVRELEAEIAAAPRGKAFMLQKKRERVMKEEKMKLGKEALQAGYERLRRQVLADRKQPLNSRSQPPDQPPLMLHAVLLSQQQKEPALLDALETLEAEWQAEGLRAEWAGPWPIFNFLNLAPTAPS